MRRTTSRLFISSVLATLLAVGTLSPASASTRAPSAAPKNLRMTIIDGSQVDYLKICWDKVSRATSYRIYINASLMAVTGSDNCFQFNPELSRFQSKTGQLSNFQVQAVNRAGAGPVSNAKQAIKLVHNPDFDTWEVPTPSLVKRCGYEAGFFVVGAAGVVLGFASGGAALPAVLAIVASSGPLVKCVT